jgi:hypothetical protein
MLSIRDECGGIVWLGSLCRAIIVGKDGDESGEVFHLCSREFSHWYDGQFHLLSFSLFSPTGVSPSQTPSTPR